MTDDDRNTTEDWTPCTCGRYRLPVAVLGAMCEDGRVHRQREACEGRKATRSARACDYEACSHPACYLAPEQIAARTDDYQEEPPVGREATACDHHKDVLCPSCSPSITRPYEGQEAAAEPDVVRALECLTAIYHHPAVQGTDAQRWARMAREALTPPARKATP